MLKLSKELKSSPLYCKVFISIDRSPEQQENHRELVKKLKKKIETVPSKHWYIKNNKIVCDERVLTEESEQASTSSIIIGRAKFSMSNRSSSSESESE